MGQALYRKYRSKSFSEVVGQEHVTKTLQAAIKSGRISHAYLFTGPRGVGKTSVARILAHEVNKIDYGDEQTHLDIIEIDAASNRRIDEIRDLREKVHITPTSSRYKVYIIDEVHMLTREAFNALLKTLEEPPAHVIFILATTEAHKLPETIISRTQRYNFKPLSGEVATKHLAGVAKHEKISISDEALGLLAEFGEGSLRDSLSLLDQLAAMGHKIDASLVRQQLGLPAAEQISRLIDLTFSGKNPELIDTISQLRDEGNEAGSIAKMLSKELRKLLRNGDLPQGGTDLLGELARLSGSGGTMDNLEIALLQISSQQSEAKSSDNNVEVKPKPAAKPEPTSKESKPTTASRDSSEASSTNFDLSMWEEVLQNVKKKNASIYTALRLAKPKLAMDSLTLAFEFGFHQKKVEQATAKNTIALVIEELCGAKLTISCVVDKELVKELEHEQPQDFYNVADAPESLQTISNIFGPTEVLES